MCMWRSEPKHRTAGVLARFGSGILVRLVSIPGVLGKAKRKAGEDARGPGE